ncbi:MAG: FAD-binding oxidoreductase [Solirubrobacteraceae bacterium]|nr:FAD-binding oxidoreductase [Solirubrobacteraceae bacterium]
MSAPRPLPVPETIGDLPADTDVLVIGGGIAGTAMAYYLARAGVEVVLVERGELNREASGTNAGSLHLQIAIHQLAGGLQTANAEDRLREETRFAAEAAQLWADLEDELDGPIDLHLTGGLMVAEKPEELRFLYEKHEIEKTAGLETHVVEGRELRELAPWLSDAIIGAAYCPVEGHVNPLMAAPLFALRAIEHGAVVRTGAGVREVDALGADGGAPFRVRTALGTIRAQRIVCAAGAWATEIGRQVGLEMPIRQMPLHVNVTEARPRLIEPLVQHIGRRLTLKQAFNGTFIIGGGWPSYPDPPRRHATRWSSAAGNAAVAVDVVPALADVRLVRTWSGVNPWTDDVSPVVGASRRVPGFHAVVVGSSGYTMTPILARTLAERMVDPTLAPMPDEYSPDRPPARSPGAS